MAGFIIAIVSGALMSIQGMLRKAVVYGWQLALYS